MKHLILVSALVLFVLPVDAQIAQFSFGGANMSEIGTGGSATLFLPTSTDTFSLGWVNNRPVVGARALFKLHGWDVLAGDTQLSYSTGQLGISNPLRGVTLSRTSKDHRTQYSFFVGLTGRDYSMPFGYGIGAANIPSVGFQFSKKWKNVELGTIQAYAARLPTSLVEGRFHAENVTLASAVGILQRQFYWNTFAEYQTQHISGSFVHDTIIYQGLRTSYDSAGMGLNADGLNGGINVFHSRAGTGEIVSGGTMRGVLTVSVSKSWAAGQNILSASGTEHRGHWSVTEYFTQTDNTKSFSPGFGWSGNLLSFNVGQQTYFFPTNGHFQQALTFSIGLQLPHSSSFNLSSAILPNGHTQVIAFGSQYDQLPGSVGSEGNMTYRAGKFLITGKVVDQNGEPLEGVAIMIGKDVAISDRHGYFEMHEKRDASQSIAVDLDKSTILGNWTVREAPATATPDQTVRIVLVRS